MLLTLIQVCINAFIFCVHYLCFIRQVYVFYVRKSSLYETLFQCNILSKHHHHNLGPAHSIDNLPICIDIKLISKIDINNEEQESVEI
jgi:hypothetical protein